MANDRLFLRNKITGDKICILKHFGAGWYKSNHINEVSEAFEEWIDAQNEHFWNNPHMFEVCYELDDK